jgi:nucleosome binding factor SPN SPT16 subunit
MRPRLLAADTEAEPCFLSVSVPVLFHISTIKGATQSDEKGSLPSHQPFASLSAPRCAPVRFLD